MWKLHTCTWSNIGSITKQLHRSCLLQSPARRCHQWWQRLRKAATRPAGQPSHASGWPKDEPCSHAYWRSGDWRRHHGERHWVWKDLAHLKWVTKQGQNERLSDWWFHRLIMETVLSRHASSLATVCISSFFADDIYHWLAIRSLKTRFQIYLRKLETSWPFSNFKW